jgi:hypothetical protein
MKIIREIHLHSDTHLPIHGWLQGCWECKTITGRLITYKTVTKGKFTYKFIVHLCPHCKKLINTKEEKKEDFNNTCNEFIDDHLYTGRS